MKTFTKQLSSALLITFLLGLATNLWAQRNVSYRDLAMRNQERPISFDFIVLPGDSESEVKFTSVFSFSYSYLPFKKTGNRGSENQFFSAANLSMEVFKAGKNFSKRKRDDNISVEGLEPAGRALWADTAYAKTYEQSQSKTDHLRGYLDVALKPGNYNYVLQMKRGEETESRMSRTQSVRLYPYSEMPTGNIILGEKLQTNSNTPRMQLTTMGSNVKYAENFYLMAYLPGHQSGDKYALTINKLAVADEDTSTRAEVYSANLSEDDIRTGIHPKISSTDQQSYINLHASDQGYAYALLEIPNKNFSNALYRLTIKKDGQQRPVARGTYRSLWVDMPTSLLNLDVAIDMLRFVADDKTIDNLSSGSQMEREKKFREYWEQRDPTPDTEFNELMAEYYRRIDYAYRNYTSNNVLGYNSDQGEVYIKFGPPQNIERKFPTDGATTEIWTYQNRRFVFKATTGFGDFKLVNNQSE